MRGESKQLASLCLDAADRVAIDGFVPIRSLVEHFGAQLSARPLLCEGMLAAPATLDGKWLVLVDSDKSGFDDSKYHVETGMHALPPRLRFTVAHELIHLLQFRNLPPPSAGSKRKATEMTIVDDLEDEADMLSPLLLIAEKSLAAFCDDNSRTTLSDWIRIRKAWGVSREVLIQRLNLLSSFDRLSLRYKPKLRQTLLGIGSWRSRERASLAEWPKPFRNLDEGWIPEFLATKGDVSPESIRDAFPATDFILNGGRSPVTEAQVWMGTMANPRSEKLHLRMEVEPVVGKQGVRFLYLIHALPKEAASRA